MSRNFVGAFMIKSPYVYLYYPAKIAQPICHGHSCLFLAAPNSSPASILCEALPTIGRITMKFHIPLVSDPNNGMFFPK
jgi:hypothetical protein